MEIFVADAWETGAPLGKSSSARCHALCDHRRPRPICLEWQRGQHLRMKAQKLDNHVGKTLRLRDDGSVPPDNPSGGGSEA